MVKDFLERIFWVENQLQLAHWQEQRGFHHETLGKFYKKVVKGFDKLIEAYLGDRTKQILISDSLYKLDNHVDLQEIINTLRVFLDDLHEEVQFNERGLGNLVDDLYNITEQYSYLLNRK
jgi:hypothetical protein